jgi:hypothetical protein
VNPYDLPTNPKVTIRKCLIWIALLEENVTAADVERHFKISGDYASVMMLKLHRWGYLKRWKSNVPPRVYFYALSRFGKSTAKRWEKKK